MDTDENKDKKLENTVITSAPVTPDALEDAMNSIINGGSPQELNQETPKEDVTAPSTPVEKASAEATAPATSQTQTETKQELSPEATPQSEPKLNVEVPVEKPTTLSNPALASVESHKDSVKIESGVGLNKEALQGTADKKEEPAMASPNQVNAAITGASTDGGGTAPIDLNGGNFTDKVEAKKPKSGIGRTISLIFVFGCLFGYLIFFDQVNNFITDKMSEVRNGGKTEAQVTPTPTATASPVSKSEVLTCTKTTTDTFGTTVSYAETYNSTNLALKSYKIVTTTTASSDQTILNQNISLCVPANSNGVNITCNTNTPNVLIQTEDYDLEIINKYNSNLNGNNVINPTATATPSTTTEPDATTEPNAVVSEVPETPAAQPITTTYTFNQSVNEIQSAKLSDGYTCTEN